MKGVMQMLILIVIIFIGVPLVIGLAAWDANGTYTPTIIENRIETPKKIRVWMEEEQRVYKVDFEEYVTGVVGSEMPGSFELEALKAQSIAARTYAMARILSFEKQEPREHPDAPVCNTTHCQVYKCEEELIGIHEDGWKESQWEKVKKACRSTEGELMYYNGELVTQPLFFSSSGGQTENSEDVFSGAYPYLVSVSSPYEEGATHSNEKKAFSAKEIKSLLNDKYKDRDTGTISIDNIKILSRTAGGRVDEIKVGDCISKGTEVRNALGLSSALFSIASAGHGKDTKIVFTSNGFGHGVGMSQYGANGMAKEGKDYREIIEHYYTGVIVS